MKFKLLLFLLVFALASFSWGQTCHITSDSTPPAVNGGATHNFTTDCTSATWSVSGAGSINSSGVYTAPATIWARDVSRGWQVLPDNSVYKLPINTLPVDNRSSYWMQRVIDNCPTCVTYHYLKFNQPGILNFYDNVITNSTATQLMHFSNTGASGQYQNTNFPIPPIQNLSMQNGWSQDILAGLDRHMFSINSQTGDDAEIYNIFSDYQTIITTIGNPTHIAYTTHTIRTLQTPIRVYITGFTGACSILNGNFLAAVVSQIPGVSGVLSIPVNTTGFTCTGTPKMTGCSGSVAGCNICNSIGGQHWFPYSNAITGGTDAGGSPFSASSVHMEEWWNVVQKGILDPACNCITLGHAIRTTLSNSYISPRDTWPAILGRYVTGGHPNSSLSSVTTGTTTVFTTTADLSAFTPCAGYTYSVGCTFRIVIGNQGAYTGTWIAANGNWLATVVDIHRFSVPLNSTGFPVLPAGGTFTFDWMPYGSHIRLKASFDESTVCTSNLLTDKCPYEKAILNTLKVYGLIILDGTIPGDNWDSGVISSEFDPDQLTLAANDLKHNAAMQNIEQHLEIVDMAGQQVNFQLYTDFTNQIGLSNYHRVTVTASKFGFTPSSIDVQLQGTAIGTDHERITMVTGTTYQINAWVSGNVNTSYTAVMSPLVTGALCCSGGIITAPSTLANVTKTTVIITSVADPTANVYIDVFFVPVSTDNKIRLAFGQHAISYTDTLGKVWYGQDVVRGFNSTFEIADGIGFAALNGTWTHNSANWISGGTIDPQLYGQSTSSQNDTNLFIVLPNGSYNLTLYGEPGYGNSGAGHNVYDVEANGTILGSYLDGYTLSGSQLYHGYTSNYNVTITNGLLNFNGRERTQDTSGYGVSWSSLLITPGSSLLQILTMSLSTAIVNVPYSQTLVATGGTLPYSWSLDSGSLCTGLSLSSGGIISGTPTVLQTCNFVVKVTDNDSTTATQALSISVRYPTLIITTPPCQIGIINVFYSCTQTYTGGSGTNIWSISAGTLPTGLAINQTTGAITGIPREAGNFSFTVKAVDNENPNQIAFQNNSIVINGISGLSIITDTCPIGNQGVGYRCIMVAVGGVPPYRWSVTPVNGGFNGCAPGLITIDPTTGTFSGIPISPRLCFIGVRVQDTNNNSFIQAVQILIQYPKLIITTPLCPDGAVNVPYHCSLDFTGGNGSNIWSVISGSLPFGVGLNSTTGELAGTPTTMGDYFPTIQVVDTENPPQTDSSLFEINIINGMFNNIFGPGVSLTGINSGINLN